MKMSRYLLALLFTFNAYALEYKEVTHLKNAQNILLGKIYYLNQASTGLSNQVLEVLIKNIAGAELSVPSDKKFDLSEVYKTRYFFGHNKQVSLLFESITLSNELSDALALELCHHLKCDIVYKGPLLKDYYPSTKWSEILKDIKNEKNYHFYDQGLQFSFRNIQSEQLKNELIKSTLPELIYFGDAGQILYLNTALVNDEKIQEQKNGTYLILNGEKKQVLKRLIGKDELKVLVESSNSSCGFSGDKDSLYTCSVTAEQKIMHPKKWPQELGLKYWNGSSQFFFPEDGSTIFPHLIKLAPPTVAYEVDKVNYYLSDSALNYLFHEKKFDLSADNYSTKPNIQIKYFQSKKFMGYGNYHQLGSDTRKILHETILENLNVDSYEVYEINANNEIVPIGTFEVPEFKPIEVTKRRAEKESNLIVALDIEQRSQQVMAPALAPFMTREEQEDVSPNVYIKWWPKNKSWGVSFNFERYNNRYLDTGVLKSGINTEYELMSEYRLIKYSPNFKYIINLGFGLDYRKFDIKGGTALSSFETYELPIKFETEFIFDHFTMVGAFRLSPVLVTTQVNSASNPWSEMTGYGRTFEAKFKKKIMKNVYFTLGGIIRFTDINFDDEKYKLKERGGSVGLEFPFSY
ncbi:MAG: hypothetical protein JNM93_08320 [Bacteriovoracaceae bacterium]|nr:hypothetical protein [Bacteriovoracaceae bacterium]